MSKPTVFRVVTSSPFVVVCINSTSSDDTVVPMFSSPASRTVVVSSGCAVLPVFVDDESGITLDSSGETIVTVGVWTAGVLTVEIPPSCKRDRMSCA